MGVDGLVQLIWAQLSSAACVGRANSKVSMTPRRAPQSHGLTSDTLCAERGTFEMEGGWHHLVPCSRFAVGAYPWGASQAVDGEQCFDVGEEKESERKEVGSAVRPVITGGFQGPLPFPSQRLCRPKAKKQSQKPKPQTKVSYAPQMPTWHEPAKPPNTPSLRPLL